MSYDKSASRNPEGSESHIQQESALLAEATSLSKAAFDMASSAAAIAEKSSNLLARLLALANRVGPSEQKKNAPDPKRSEAAKRAWITIRNNRASKAAAQINLT